MNNTSQEYTKLWKKVDSLETKGLPKSALEAAEQIYQKAKRDHEPAQLVKAIIHKLKYTSAIQDENVTFGPEDLKKEIAVSGFPERPVLHSMLAELYWQYYTNNTYRFHDRTHTEEFKADDIRTWDLRKLVEETVKEHKLALAEPEKLKSIQIDIYDEILSRGQEGRKFRPTLYDFLGHRAVDFFMQAEPNIIRPAEAFLINDDAYFLPASQFAHFSLRTSDTTSYKYNALKIFQDLLQSHLNDEDPSPLADADLKRLKYVYENSVSSDKDALYLKSLEVYETTYRNLPLSAEASYEIANYWFRQANNYKPLESEDHKWDAKKSIALCEAAIARFPQSEGAQLCRSLISTIKTKSFNFVMEEVNIPSQAIRAKVNYRNVTRLYFRVIQTSLKEHEQLRRAYEKYYDKYQEYKEEPELLVEHYASRPALQTFEVNLPDDGDFQEHAVELKINALPVGYYIVLAGSDEKMSFQHNGVSYAFTSVSNISFIHKNLPNNNTELHLMHRESGHPLKDAAVKVSASVYDYNKSRYTDVLIGNYKTDANGYLHIQAGKEYRYLQIEITTAGDFLSTRQLTGTDNYYSGLYQGYQNEPHENDIHLSTLFFTDRSIYRPGQTIYFKGILIEFKGKKERKPIAQRKVTVQLYDVNGQQAGSIQVETNNYGSYSGSFIAPSTGLLGQMRISDGYGDEYISVEEYKRPKFEVKLDKAKESFRLNEEVTIGGSAKAYSGANIDHAVVKYRVVRKATYPEWWFFWKGYFPSAPDMEILNGTAETDEKGEFRIRFKAIPDLSVPAESKPYFSYFIYADVTDINGETRSASSTVKAGYTALKINFAVPDEIGKEQEKEFKLLTTNLDGEYTPAAGTLTIHKLRSPSKIYRNRLWARPDKFILTKEEFEKNFPYDEYAEENNHFKWEKEQSVYKKAFDTEKEQKIRLDNLNNWASGMYRAELKSKDRFGAEVLEVKYFSVISKKEKTLPYATPSWFAAFTETAEPGETAEILFGSSYNDVTIIYETELSNKTVSRKYLTVNKEQGLSQEKILEDYRGNVSFHYTFIRNNRIYLFSHTVNVPYSNKELEISFESFRDKLEPGQKEQWKIRIKGPEGDKVAAEMAATLYDASLDAFRAHAWNFDIYPYAQAGRSWDYSNSGFSSKEGIMYNKNWNPVESVNGRSYDYLNWFGYYYYGYERDRVYMRMSQPVLSAGGNPSRKMKKGEAKDESEMQEVPDPMMDVKAGVTFGFGNGPGAGVVEGEKNLEGVKARKDFNETAFFYPHLETDAEGDVIISFTIPEALTRWKLLGLAHTPDLKYALTQKELVTRKELMVVPNPPRFFREGDKIVFSAKISNVSENDLNGMVQLMLFDAFTMKPIDNELGNQQAVQSFSTKAGLSASVNWSINIPSHIQAITYRVVAKAGSFSDGEESTLPVLTNRTLVTESIPLWVRSKQTKSFSLEKLVSNKSNTLTHHKLTLEFTSNPAWYAVQALPYLMEYPYECAEQIFSRFYANSLATHIANASPVIQKVFDSWKHTTPDALLSNLEKNQELKNLLLEETPWVREAKGESERKRRIGLLFDLSRMSKEQDRALEKLSKMQKANGAWVWFEGMPEDRYITQHIVTGLGHLDHLGVKHIRGNNKIWNMTRDAMSYLDKKIRSDYETLKNQEARKLIKLSDNHLSYLQIHYLYARSFFPDLPVDKADQEAVNYFTGQAKIYWQDQTRYMQGMIALALQRKGDPQTPRQIVKSLREYSISSEEMGMYWKEQWGYFWHQAPVETQALMIEVFEEVAKDQKAVDDLRVWLLKQKETQDWKTTKATSEACYALLLRGSNWLTTEIKTGIKVGDVKVDPSGLPDVKAEAGTGYFKTSWSGSEIKNDMGKVTVTKEDDGISWGGLYWQYFEDLDKITPHETPLKLKRQLFLEKPSPTGPVLTPVTDKTTLQPGDLIKVRIELRVDRDMEYVHMKDMRAAGLEPVNVLSQYKYQDGLGYYESTRDAATSFFFGFLPKGTYVFEYPLRVNLKGEFSNGITTIQCMYAPQFSSHSEGVRIRIGE